MFHITFHTAVSAAMDRSKIIDGVSETRVLAGRYDVIYLAACCNTADNYMLTDPAARTPTGVDEEGNLPEPVSAASHRPGARGSDCHTTMIGEESEYCRDCP